MLAELALTNFRALSQKELSFGERTLVAGGNGTGKTSVIEALRLLSVGKSFRSSKQEELISFGADFLRLEAELVGEDKKRVRYDYFFGSQFDQLKQRQVTVNGKKSGTLDVIGLLPSVLFTPEDVEIVLGMPQQRRRFLDGVLWQTSAEFRAQFLDFNKVLRERSRLLTLIRQQRAQLKELAPWNELLARYTEFIRSERQLLVDFIVRDLGDPKARVGRALSPSVTYKQSQIALEEGLEDEIRIGQNLFGAHRDDLEILLDDRSARQYASRGQARTVVLLLKFSEGRFLAEKLGYEPIMLLDDIFSELDSVNTELLMNYLETNEQVVATVIEPNPKLDWPVIRL